MRKIKRLLYDCFTFFNELDLLEIRLNTLNDVVDKFVLVEATRTQNNEKKPLYYNLNKDRYKKFAKKIIHIIVDKYPKKINQWTIENWQRNQIAKGLARCKDDDIIMISDLDEIVNQDIIINEIKSIQDGEIKVFKLNSSFLYLNLWHPYLIVDNRAKMLFYKDFKTILNNDFYEHCALEPKFNKGTTATKIRLYNGPKQKFINNAGWHFSWLGDEQKVLKKLKCVCEGTKTATMEDAKKIREAFISKLKPVYLNKYFPEYIVNNQELYKNLIIKPKYTFSLYRANLYLIYKIILKYFLRFICCCVPTKELRRKVRNSSRFFY
jgi:beta-1,4-mannosyl-glycoprotein beta-1,4-N-acetylglucosaminyltransferase